MALWHYSDLTAVFQHWGTAGFAALCWNKLSHKMRPEEPDLRGRCRYHAPAPWATDVVTSMAFAEAQGEQQRLLGAGAAMVPSRCWKGECAVTSRCSGGRLEGRGGQKVFRKPYPWPKKIYIWSKHTLKNIWIYVLLWRSADQHSSLVLALWDHALWWGCQGPPQGR